MLNRISAWMLLMSSTLMRSSSVFTTSRNCRCSRSISLIASRYSRLTEELSSDGAIPVSGVDMIAVRSEEHTSELQSLMRISYAVFCLKKKKRQTTKYDHNIMTIYNNYEPPHTRHRYVL